LAFVVLLAFLGQPGLTRAQIDADECFGCHGEVQELWKETPHADLGCETCHGDVQAHLEDPANELETSLDPATCGNCHQDQYQSSLQVNWDAEARQVKGVPEGRSPLQDKLLAPHGFTVEHNEPRSHAFMVSDQLAVDRFYAGRYRYKDAWASTRPGKLWDVIEDTGETRPDLAKAGYPVCLQCKTSDLILDWKYLGDPDPEAKWSRTSDVNELVKAVSNPVGCIHCHDPHGASPRVVRDALIEAVERDGATPYSEDSGKDAMQVVGFRDGFRKIGLLEQAGSDLLRAQCQVEYSCNPGTPAEGEGKITTESRLTNQFPWKNVFDMLDYYDEIGFRDFRHAVTGARLVKLQHPEMETYWESPHHKAGVRCVDCHMGKVKGEGGEEFTSHAMLRPAHNIEGACYGCHQDSSPKELEYQIETVRNYTRGKIRKAEYSLSILIDTYEEAARQGVSEDVLKKARRQHEIAHVLWEWWTAENSDGWHNPDLARRSLLDAQAAAEKGVQILNEALEAKLKPAVVK